MAEEQGRVATAFWADGIEPAERALRMVKAQKLVCDLPAETYRRDRDLFNIRLYENNPVITLYSFAGKYYSEASTLALPPPEQSKNNKAKAAIDTLASQIASTDQRARFVVVDGKYRQQRRARAMQDFADGLVYELQLHRLKARAFLDAAILESGVGCIQFYEENGRAAAQRVLATELAIDPLDGLVDGKPRTLYRRRPMPRDYVLAVLADTDAKREAVKAAQPVATGGAPSDHIEVYEAWHLPTTEKSGDGWHILAIDHADGMLVCEPYKKTHHEIVWFSIEDRFTTSWGLSLMTQARPLQMRINANDYRIERAQKLFHAGHLYVNRLAKIKKSALSNEIGSVWEGNGDAPPQQILFQAVTKEMYDQIASDGRLIFDNLGINVGASTGQTALGANAPAEALREEDKKVDSRNSRRQQRWETFHLDCLRAGLGVVREIVSGEDGEGSSSYKVAKPGQRGLTRTDWQQAAMDEKDYVLEIMPASPLPKEPGALIAKGRELVADGIWKPDELADAVKDLDIEGRVSRRTSQRRGLEKIFDSMLYDKVAVAMPSEFTNVQMALDIGSDFLAQGEEDGVPDKNLERIRRYLKRCKKMLPPQAPAGAPAANPAQVAA